MSAKLIDTSTGEVVWNDEATALVGNFSKRDAFRSPETGERTGEETSGRLYQ
jgi:hypothetical protein